MKWDHPEDSVWLAESVYSRDVTLEVFQPDDDDLDRYLWWVLESRGGRPVAVGEANGLAEAQRQCEAAVASK